MLILLGILLDGVVTLALGVLIGTQSKMSSFFYVSLAALHGLMAGVGIILFMAVRAVERDVAASPEAITTDQARREAKVVPISEKPRLDQAA